MKGDPDDTVIVRPVPGRRLGGIVAVAVSGLVLVGAIAGSWWLMHGPPASSIVDRPETVAAPQVEAIPLAAEAAIQRESPAVRTVMRFAGNPAVVVIDFAILGEQASMFNRLAAWAEKAGVAHDRVPTEETLMAAIVASGATAETYYYGHDYSGAVIEQFFALAAAEHVALRPAEEELRRIAARAAAEPAGLGAVITVVRADADNGISAQARATILHHELSHGEYFTNPAYKDFVTSFWDNELTAPERAAFRAYLAREGYDPALEDLMRNEMQAYLMHTPDPAFFELARLSIPPTRLAQIRSAFLAGMPAGWLRDAVVASGIVPAAPAPRHSSPRRRRRIQRAGSVSTGTTAAPTLPPRRRKSSMAVFSADR